MSEWKNVCFECGDKKREIRDLKVRVADCEGAIERREQFIAQAHSERDSALDAEVVAWAEVDRLQAENETLRARVAELESNVFEACAEVLEREADSIGAKQGLGKRMAKLRIGCLAQRLRTQADELERQSEGGDKHG